MAISEKVSQGDGGLQLELKDGEDSSRLKERTGKRRREGGNGEWNAGGRTSMTRVGNN